MAAGPILRIGRLKLYLRDLISGPILVASITYLLERDRPFPSSWPEFVLKFLAVTALYYFGAAVRNAIWPGQGAGALRKK